MKSREVRGTVSLSSTRESNEGTSVIFRDCITFNERKRARAMFLFSLVGSGGSFGRRVGVSCKNNKGGQVLAVCPRAIVWARDP